MPPGQLSLVPEIMQYGAQTCLAGRTLCRAFLLIGFLALAFNVDFAAEGLGVAIVPRLALQEGAYPALREIALRGPVVTRALTLIVRRNASLSPAAQALYDLVLPRAQR